MPLKICIVALNAYPAIDSRVPGGIGGVETRSWMFARGLAQRDDCEVTFVVRHWQPLRDSEVQGVRLRMIRDRLYAVRESLALRLQRTGRFPYVTLREPRLSDAFYLPLLAARKLAIPTPDPLKPLRAFQDVDADVYLTFGVQNNAATVISSAHSLDRPALLFLGSDGDLDERYLSDSKFVSTYRDSAVVCRWAIENADQILCQTPRQQERLSLFGRTAEVISNPIDLDQWEQMLADVRRRQNRSTKERYVLWVGRAENVHKRPIDCIEVAKRCPDIPFLMILNKRDDSVEAEIRRSAPSNVRIIEKVPFPEMPGVMERAAVLLNTSSLEGFPNTYLQAAATGIPIASLNVESQFLRESHAGECADGDLERLTTIVQHFWQSPRTSADQQIARQYVETHHSLRAKVDQLYHALHEARFEKRRKEVPSTSDQF